jgi:hypothetical protein
MSAGTRRMITRCDLLSYWSCSLDPTNLPPSCTALSQSMCRSHRIGQSKTVHVYRLVSTGTMERMIYEQQMKKVDLSTAVVDNARKEDPSSTSTATSTTPADATSLSGFLRAPAPPDPTKLLSLEESDVDGDQVLVSCVQKLGHWLVSAKFWKFTVRCCRLLIDLSWCCHVPVTGRRLPCPRAAGREQARERVKLRQPPLAKCRVQLSLSTGHDLRAKT